MILTSYTLHQCQQGSGKWGCLKTTEMHVYSALQLHGLKKLSAETHIHNSTYKQRNSQILFKISSFLASQWGIVKQGALLLQGDTAEFSSLKRFCSSKGLFDSASMTEASHILICERSTHLSFKTHNIFRLRIFSVYKLRTNCRLLLHKCSQTQLHCKNDQRIS